MRHNIERLDYLGASGWAFEAGADRLTIEARVNGSSVAEVKTTKLRPDVKKTFSEAPITSGFSLKFLPVSAHQDGPIEIAILAKNGKSEPVELARASLPGRGAICAAFAAAERPSISYVGPYPRPIMALAHCLAPLSEEVANNTTYKQIVSQIKLAAVSMQLFGSCGPLVDYFRYLRACWSHFQFVSRYFPAWNEGKSIDAKDWNCKQNSPQEMMSIANHLYVLRSYGVSGEFAELGCFKGYSSAMLSFACYLLGMPMHVFDSFEGLPPSDSTYYRSGDYSGSINEVRENVRKYGVIEGVKFHKGYFDATVKRSLETIPVLAAFWMDVDLASSARDLIPIASKLDRRGAFFSHECGSGQFLNGKILPLAASPDNVVPPILEYFAASQLSLTGRFILGTTGSFWLADTGIPVLPNDCLMELVKSI